MMLRSLATAIAAIQLVVALPTYNVPKALLQAADCIMPEGFEVDQFQAWFPAEGNNHSATVNFAYWDKSTSLQTICHLNGTSQNVGRPGLAARYSCEDPIVQFIWQNNTLRLIEKACPESNSTSNFEASGSLKPNLTCVETAQNSSFGLGKDCFSTRPFLSANFTSLQPTPRKI